MFLDPTFMDNYPNQFAFLTDTNRLPPRASGPIIDWKAFTEPVYLFFVMGIFFTLWNAYFTFYYVSQTDY